MEVLSKYRMTAFTSVVTEAGEVLSKEDFISRLVKLGMDEEDASKVFKRSVDGGTLVPVDADDQPAEEAPEETPEAPAEAPAPKKRGRPKKK